MRRSLVLLCAFALACTEQSAAPTAPRTPTTPTTDAADFVPPGVTDFLFAHHTATEEVPPTTSQAGGTTAIWFTGPNTIAWVVEIPNPASEQFNVGHIHRERRGVNGPVVQFLMETPTNEQRIFVQSSATISPALALALRNHPDFYYVNYHTSQFPGGAVRGQLEWRTKQPAAIVTAGSTTNTFDPPSVTIPASRTVTWVFGSRVHNVVFSADQPPGGDIPDIANASVSRTFPTAGTFPYTCTIHPGMNGTVVVE